MRGLGLGLLLTPGVVALVVLAACGASPAPPPPVAVSSWRDPPPRPPAADPRPRSGAEPTGALALGGADAARALVVDLLAAIRDGDAAAAEATLAERVESAAPPHADAPRAGVDRVALVRHWLTLARSARLSPETPLGELVVAESIRVEPAMHHYEADALPRALERADLVVSFSTTASGTRAFAGLAPGGEGLLVVRPGPEPRIVAR